MDAELVQGLDVAVLEAVLDGGSLEARHTLTRQLSLLIAADDTPALEREQVLPILLKLAVDPERSVRAVLIEELTSVENLNPDLLFSIIAAEDDLALAFLATTPALNPWHMMAVLRVGDEARQAIVAGRSDLSSEAASFVVKHAPVAIVLALMDNPVVEFDTADLQTLYERFGNSNDLVERLLALPDLPLEIRIMQAKRAATRMRQLMAERGWMPANDASELVADAEEGAILQVLVEAGDDELMAAAAFLAGKQMLTPSLIMRAACLGEKRAVEATLAHLSGLAPAKAAAMMYARGGGGMKSIVGKAGLPSSCFGLLVAFAEVSIEARDDEIELSREAFGRRLLEALMTRYEAMNAAERAKQISYIGKLGDEKVRKIARQLKTDIQRAA